MAPRSAVSIEQRLLDAGLEAATIHGIAKLSMGDVARRAGLSRQTLYRYFPSKDALVAAIVGAGGGPASGPPGIGAPPGPPGPIGGGIGSGGTGRPHSIRNRCR